MAGIAGITFSPAGSHQAGEFLSAIDLPGTGHQALAENRHGAFATVVAAPRFLAERHQEDANILVQMSGHVVAEEPVSWTRVAEELRSGRTGMLETLSGRFAVALLDKRAARLHLITDRIGQCPLYFMARPRGLAFATSPAAFSRLDQLPALNERWFREMFMLNFPVSRESFLHGVERLPPGNVRTIHLSSERCHDTIYAPHLQAAPRATTDRQEMVWAKQIFARRMPLYAGDNETAMLGVSNGFDSRTLLAHFLDRSDLKTYTYGLPESLDLRAGRTLARRLELDHSVVPFDAEFEQLLPRLMTATVWLSSGAQTVIRSSLLHAYAQAAGSDRRVDVLLSGASGDHLFRGHGNVPSIVSPTVDEWFRTGQLPADTATVAARIFNDPAAAVAQIREARDTLEQRHGSAQQTSTHLGYLTYEVPANYFSGEAALAEHFFDYRTPFCDREILKLAWTTRLGTLRFSRFKPDRWVGNLQRNYLAANLIGVHPRLRHEWIQGRPLGAFCGGNPAVYYAISGACWAMRRLRKEPVEIHTESWSTWFAETMRPVIKRLLAPGAGIEAIVRRPFIDRALMHGDMYWLNKLVSAEIIIRLLENRWQLNGVDAGPSAVPPTTNERPDHERIAAGYQR